jgi:hypothetical protein
MTVVLLHVRCYCATGSGAEQTRAESALCPCALPLCKFHTPVRHGGEGELRSTARAQWACVKRNGICIQETMRSNVTAPV